MWFKSSGKTDIRASLRALRSRILADGAPFFRVITDGFDSRDFFQVDDESYESCRKRAREYALDLASTRIGSSVFVSERRELDGVQALVGVQEIVWERFGDD